MAKPDIKKVREGFDETLAHVWERFGEAVENSDPADRKEYIDPFSSTFWISFSENFDEEVREGIHYDVGWLEGVSAVTGWSLRRPGPREWSPRP